MIIKGIVRQTYEIELTIAGELPPDVDEFELAELIRDANMEAMLSVGGASGRIEHNGRTYAWSTQSRLVNDCADWK